MYIFWKMLNIRGREVVGLYIYLEILSMLKVLKIPIPFLQILNVFYTCKIFNVQRSILANFQYCRFLQVSEVPTLQILNDLQFWDAYILQILNIDDLWGAYIENSQYLRSLHLQFSMFNVLHLQIFNIVGSYKSLRCLHFKFLMIFNFEMPTFFQILNIEDLWGAYIENSQCLRSLYTCTSLWGAYTSNSWKFSMIEVSTSLHFSNFQCSKVLHFSNFQYCRFLQSLWGSYTCKFLNFEMPTFCKILNIENSSIFQCLRSLQFKFSMFKVSAIQIFNV